jgi:hypothetical protein
MLTGDKRSSKPEHDPRDQDLLTKARRLEEQVKGTDLVASCASFFRLRDDLSRVLDAPPSDPLEVFKDLERELHKTLGNFENKTTEILRARVDAIERFQAQQKSATAPTDRIPHPSKAELEAAKDVIARNERGENVSGLDLADAAQTMLFDTAATFSDRFGTQASEWSAAVAEYGDKVKNIRQEILDFAGHQNQWGERAYMSRKRWRALIRAAVVVGTFLLPLILVLYFHRTAEEIIQDRLPKTWPNYWSSFILIGIVMAPIEVARGWLDRRIDRLFERLKIAHAKLSFSDLTGKAVDCAIRMATTLHDYWGDRNLGELMNPSEGR